MQKGFLMQTKRERETAVDRLWDLIAVRDGANTMTLSYKTNVEGNDADNAMSEFKKRVNKNESKIFGPSLPNCLSQC
jgi:hypothetical protein